MAKEKPIKPKKIRQPRAGGALWPVLLALLLVGGAVAVLMYPIPGLTAPTKEALAAEAAAKESAAKAASTETTKAQTEKEAALARQEADLKAREDAIKQQETQVNALLRDLQGQQTIIDNLRQTAGIIASMPPYKAAPLVEAMDPVTAAQVLRILDKNQAASILSYVATDKGALITKEFLQPTTASTTKP